ncbi:imelysin family protein [Notoacmeibacter marinus]|uniref:imelysin family protein n=1 Tax=Notoacmeibacter marinus TaxID=1876515 RepID=UPI000DF2531F|nr:imelysin family protein [Notoacmeibacter marinus]
MRGIAAAFAVIGALLALPLGPVPALSAERDEALARAVLADAVESFIRPGYRQLQERSGALKDAVGALCDAPSDHALGFARQAFGETVAAWSRLESIRFGPILRQNAAERLYFFPDRRGIALRQVQGVLATKDETAASAQSLVGKSVALQGLGTLEYLLFGTGAQDLAAEGAGGFRCDFAEAVTERIEATATLIADDWAAPDGIAGRFASPDPAYADFQTVDDSLRALLGAFINGLELIADTRIAPFLGGDAAAARPKAAAWWRSGLTGRALSENLGGLRDLFAMASMARLLPPDDGGLTSEIRFEFGNAQRALSGAGQSLPELAQTEGARQPVAYLLIVTQSLRSLFAERFAGAVGLVAGFSSLDGD